MVEEDEKEGGERSGEEGRGGEGTGGADRQTKAQKSLAMYHPSVRGHNPLLLPMDSRSFKQPQSLSQVLYLRPTVERERSGVWSDIS